jgi:hypothetical protein
MGEPVEGNWRAGGQSWKQRGIKALYKTKRKAPGLKVHGQSDRVVVAVKPGKKAGGAKGPGYRCNNTATTETKSKDD